MDILIVGYLIYRIYRLLKGSIAFNIFVGVMLLFGLWWFVKQLGMDLLSMILGQFVSVGVILVVIIFQPEVRRFLLLLGDTTLKGKLSFFEDIFTETLGLENETKKPTDLLHKAILKLSESKTGALIVLVPNSGLEHFNKTGVKINAEFTTELLESIFSKESPLHDGATVLSNGKIMLASCILPITEDPSLPVVMGLRHRAAIGITESINVSAFIVSEETGRISFARKGKLYQHLEEDQILQFINLYFK